MTEPPERCRMHPEVEMVMQAIQSRDDGGRPTDRSPIGAVGAC